MAMRKLLRKCFSRGSLAIDKLFFYGIIICNNLLSPRVEGERGIKYPSKDKVRNMVRSFVERFGIK